MFGFTKSKRIGVYIDYSNIYHAKYTLGREYDMDNFLNCLLQDKTVTQVGFYGAYDKTNIKQFNWTKKLQTTFSDPKFYFYFKKLELRGGNHKGNVDTEMGYDIGEHKDRWDTLILFSGDGDFQYIIDQLISQHTKQIVIVSTRGHIASELVNYTQQYNVDICRFVDIFSDNPITAPIKICLKNTARGVCIPSELNQRIATATTKEIEELRDWVQCILNFQKDTCPLPTILNTLTNKNKFATSKTILHWQITEKQGLLDYLNSLI